MNNKKMGKNTKRVQRFVLKKINKQLLSVAGSVLIVLGSYAMVPVQVLAAETATEAETTQVQQSNTTLPTIASSELGTDTQPSEPNTETQPTTTSEEATIHETQPSVTNDTQQASTETEQNPANEIKNPEETDQQADTAKAQPQTQTADTIENDWQYINQGTYVEITDYKGKWRNITIPAKIEDLPVKIDLGTVLHTQMVNKKQIEVFKIESSDKEDKPVELTGSFKELFAIPDIWGDYNNNVLTTVDFGNADCSGIQDMSGMFRGCKQLETLSISGWNTSQVEDMSHMFDGCNQLQTLDISKWNTSRVEDMSYLFTDCKQLETLDISDWVTSNVQSMKNMFYNCMLEQLSLSNWDMSKVENTENMFGVCKQLQMLDISGWNMSSIKEMYQMFYRCEKLTTLDISGWNTSQVKNMENVFASCDMLETLNLSGWNTNKVTTMNGMFHNCLKLSTLTLSSDFKFTGSHMLLSLPKNTETTTHHWVKDNYAEVYDLTNAFTEAHNKLTGPATDHAYTIQKKYRVSFDVDDGIGDAPVPQFVFENKTAVDPNYTGIKIGWAFDYWTLNNQPFSFDDTLITEPIELVASWRKARYTIQYDANKGDGSMADQMLTVDEEQSLSESQFTRTGYDFVGWNKESDGSGDSYSDKEVVENLSMTEGAQIKLYAQWKPITYTVNFDSNNGSAVSPMTYTIEQGIDNFETPTRTGYDFDGWYDGKEKVTNIKEGETGNRTLIAKWTPVTYKVTFDSAGGNAIDPMPYTIEETISTLPTPIRKGHKFMGWFEGEKLVTEIPIGGTSDRTLIAKWEAITYTITFADEGLSPITYTISDKSIALPDGPERAGYRFLGWLVSEEKLNRSAQSNNAIVRSLAAGTIGNLRLSAQYEAIKYTVNFDSASGSAIDPITFTTENSVTKLPEPARIGYRFQGWYDGETKVTELPKGTIGDKTLTAKWEKIKTIEVIENILKEENQKNRKEQDYTEDSWKVYQEAKKAAKELLKEVSPDPLKAEQVLAKLQSAIQGLTLKKAAVPTAPVAKMTNIPTSKKVYPTSQAKQYPRMNMVTTIWPGFIGTGLVAAVIALIKKNKK